MKYYRKSKNLTMEKSMQDSYTYNNTIRQIWHGTEPVICKGV